MAVGKDYSELVVALEDYRVDVSRDEPAEAIRALVDENARLTRALSVIADKRCLNASVANPNGSCDWPCVVCVARQALA